MSDTWERLVSSVREHGVRQAWPTVPPGSSDGDMNTRVIREGWRSAKALHEVSKVDELLNPLALFFGYIGDLTIDPIIRIARDWGADTIVYDPCMIAGLVAAKVVGIPAFCHGLGVWHLGLKRS